MMIAFFMLEKLKTVIIATVNTACVVCALISLTAERAVIVFNFRLFFGTVSILPLMCSAGSLTSHIT